MSKYSNCSHEVGQGLTIFEGLVETGPLNPTAETLINATLCKRAKEALLVTKQQMLWIGKGLSWTNSAYQGVNVSERLLHWDSQWMRFRTYETNSHMSWSYL